MIFNSFTFVAFFWAVFFVTILVTNFTKKPAARNFVLLVSSYFFYGTYSPSFLLLLLYVTILNYVAGIVLGREMQPYRKLVVSADIVLTLKPLLLFKCTGFLLTNINYAFGCHLGEGLMDKILMPVGISFFTFQTLSYTIDIYRGKIMPTHNVLDFALFVSFFPTVLSGPIERARNLIPQIEKFTLITLDGLISGVTLFAWEVFKKMVIADRLALYIDWAYGSADYVGGSTLALPAVFYSFQIYCDFSGYSDMAVGVARALGFDIMQNFKFPYFAHSIKEFWHRWHISLTSWFTEYVYFSLGGSRVNSRLRWAFNVSMIFLLSGIWHGAAWNFVVWGVMHAVIYLAEYKLHLQQKEENAWWKYIKTIYVFILVSFAWVFFRVDDMDKAWNIVYRSFTDIAHPIGLGSSAFQTAETILLFVLFLGFDYLIYKGLLLKKNGMLRPCSLLNLSFLLCLLFGISLFGTSTVSFVYFQF